MSRVCVVESNCYQSTTCWHWILMADIINAMHGLPGLQLTPLECIRCIRRFMDTRSCSMFRHCFPMRQQTRISNKYVLLSVLPTCVLTIMLTCTRNCSSNESDILVMMLQLWYSKREINNSRPIVCTRTSIVCTELLVCTIDRYAHALTVLTVSGSH
jgi:hypothetical protein